MKKVYLNVAALLIATSTYANVDAGFEARKQEFIKDLDIKIASFQDAKSCISSAQTHESMKVCHENLRKAHENFKAQEQDRRKHHIDDKIKHLQDEKAKLNSPQH